MDISDFNRSNTQLTNILFFAPVYKDNGFDVLKHGSVHIKYTHNGQPHELHGLDEENGQVLRVLKGVTPLQRLLEWGSRNCREIKGENERDFTITRLSYNLYDGREVVISEAVTTLGAKIRSKTERNCVELEFESEGPTRFIAVVRHDQLDLTFRTGSNDESYKMFVTGTYSGFLGSARADNRANFEHLLPKAVTMNEAGHLLPYDKGKFLRRYMSDAVPAYFATGFFEQASYAAELFNGCEIAVGRQKS